MSKGQADALSSLTLESPSDLRRVIWGEKNWTVLVAVILWSWFLFVIWNVSPNTSIYLITTHSLLVVASYGKWIGFYPKSSAEGRRKAQGQCGLDWALLASGIYSNTCPSRAASAFCWSLLGSESLAGVTRMMPGAFFSSSARRDKKQHCFQSQRSPSLDQQGRLSFIRKRVAFHVKPSLIASVFCLSSCLVWIVMSRSRAESGTEWSLGAPMSETAVRGTRTTRRKCQLSDLQLMGVSWFQSGDLIKAILFFFPSRAWPSPGNWKWLLCAARLQSLIIW